MVPFVNTVCWIVQEICSLPREIRVIDVSSSSSSSSPSSSSSSSLSSSSSWPLQPWLHISHWWVNKRFLGNVEEFEGGGRGRKKRPLFLTVTCGRFEINFSTEHRRRLRRRGFSLFSTPLSHLSPPPSPLLVLAHFSRPCFFRKGGYAFFAGLKIGDQRGTAKLARGQSLLGRKNSRQNGKK